MAGASNFITVDVDDRQMRHAFEKLELAGQNMEPLFADIGEHLLESTKQRFEEQVDPDGQPWARLSDTTKSLKPKNKEKKLFGEGYLLDGLFSRSDAFGASVNSPSEYAAMHQFGGITSDKSWIPGKVIPARPFFGISNEDENAILDLAEAYLLQALSA